MLYSCVLEEVKNRIGKLSEQKIEERKIISPPQTLTDEPLYLFSALSKTKCYQQHHTVSPKPMMAQLLDESGYINLPTHYCEECRKHFIGIPTLSLYERNFGKLYIEKRSALESNEFNDFALESRLHQFGYNVVEGKLTEKERRKILLTLLNEKKMSYFEICSGIEQSIQLFKNSSSHEMAVYKWERDLKFLGNYIIGASDE